MSARTSKVPPPWTPDQSYCLAAMAEMVGGYHHLRTTRAWGDGIAMEWMGDLSTFDTDLLTNLVVIAHRDRIRVEIVPSSPRSVKIVMHRRAGAGHLFERHPGLSDLAAKVASILHQQKPGKELVPAPKTELTPGSP